jgi:hypothetical protein
MYYYTKFQKIDQMQSFALDYAPELKIHLTRQGSPLYNGRAHVPTEKIPKDLHWRTKFRAPKINNYQKRWSHKMTVESQNDRAVLYNYAFLIISKNRASPLRRKNRAKWCKNNIRESTY